VRETKRKSTFTNLVESVLDQPEFYVELVVQLAKEETGKEIARQIAKALNEVTAPSEKDEEDLETVKTKIPAKMNKKQYVMMKPEHHLIEALASYKTLKTSMEKVLNKV
jgi:hypothetical protein